MTTIEEIEARVRVLETKADEMKAHFSARIQAGVNGAIVANGQAPAEVATDADLDSQYGSEPVRKDPTEKYWKGQSYVGVRLSECPPDYLDALSRYKDACAYMNAKNADPAKAKYIEYDKRDAARARGWAARLRNGWKSPGARQVKAQPVAYNSDADEGDVLPF